ncbi:RNA polymerase subunit sigma-70 [Flavobacterium columnare NBRC 100251 = ATCC 23463]|uniref:RNA polymerase sigma factor n=1 Tax=Flavobacterium columnare TaxID=996 RepID=UPI000BEA7FD3|nr:RNA polymerase sigma factor [Flavobacterium columnare]PDS22507.1 RNA polymerase subunit sigma-70 [Flavobacterium columnare NBRC 100251 = ATCC 23463]GEM58251.1 DNA-directed RNA polymerase sigma-70 factor [Flavobacterium columnare NBRC 100251 = ATCC 23463]
MQNEKLFLTELLNPKTQNEAFRRLIREYQKPLYYHIRNMVSDHDDTDDILQNTFIKVFQNLKNFKGESKLYSWMYRIATNETITFLNSRAKKRGGSNEDLKEKIIQKLEADIHFDGDEIQLKLHQAIASLPEKQQQVFKMKYFEELKYEEISEILKTSVGALKASYFHAVKKIEYFLNTN